MTDDSPERRDQDLERLRAHVEARLGPTIKRAEQVLIAEKTRALRPFGLTVPQYSALLALAWSDGMSAAQLARFCLVAPQTMATVLANLETKGLLVRHPSPLHLKVQVATLTKAGRALVAEADRAAIAVEARLDAAFTRQESQLLRELLERAIAALDPVQAEGA